MKDPSGIRALGRRVRRARRRVAYVACNRWYTRAFGVILPGGNASEFPAIRRHLNRRRVAATEIALPGGGRVFAFPETERRKLPSWERKRFLPSSEDGTTGHSIYHVTVFQLAGMLR